MKKLAVLCVVVAAFITNLAAQTQKVIADKIVAQVGDKIILRSDIFNAIADYKRQGQDAQLPANAECAFLEGQLIQKALMLQAQKDSLPVGEDELEGALDNRIRYFIGMYGSKEVLEEVAGKTIYQIKEDFRPSLKEQMLADAMRKKIFENIKITPNEVTNYFNKIPKDSLPYYESELEVSQIVVFPKANKDVEEYVTSELMALKRQVESGQKKFDALARLYSEEPAAKESGGQLNINRGDKNIDGTFLSAAFRLKEGQISNVIKTKFGLHIIQMVSRSGEDAIVRHIIKIPSVTEDEINAAKAKLDSIRNKILDGTLPFNAAVNKYSDDENSKSTGGNVMAQDGSTYVTIDQLDKEMVVSIRDMKVGDISKAVSFTSERGTKGVRLINLKSRSEPHRENLKDDYNKVSQRALDEKKQKLMHKWFSEHIPTYYVRIDNDFNSCNNIAEWKQVAEKNAMK
ncbi:peptidylprolyl isomerase [Foetidibacter luteolus]|uniref:peptidylprolyl isomerase n=1 Tax=Foetidibacter luteolus TaxID=2608880 RepID=UPI00129AE301|nr:peptidylprolyl isomerase [Foetidibacter luteolus]